MRGPRKKSGGEGQGDTTELACAFRIRLLLCLRGPFERQAQELASAHFACGLDDHVVLSWSQCLPVLAIGLEAQWVLPGGSSRAPDSIDRHIECATTAAPPLPQVFQPLPSIFFLG